MRTYTTRTMPHWVFLQVAAALEGYADMTRRLRQEELDIIYAAPVYRGAGGVARPTETRALKLSRVREEYERQTRAVDRALARFRPADREMLCAAIGDAPVPTTTALSLRFAMSESSVKRAKRRLWQLVAVNMGLMDIEDMAG